VLASGVTTVMHQLRSMLLASLVMLAVSVAGGCRQLTSIESQPVPPDPSLTCGELRFANTMCADCVGRSCCAEADACDVAGRCGDFARCITACTAGDMGCKSTCRTTFPDALGAEAAALQSCEASSCATICGLTCGGYVYPTAACGECGSAHCCVEEADCMRDPACEALAACEHHCGTRDDDCVLACELGQPTGVVKARAFGACLAGACSAQCIAPEWACLQKPASPAPATGPAITISYRFIDFETFDTIPGLRLLACRASDHDCTRPLAGPATTTATGEAVLRMPTNSFDGYVEVTGGGYAPLLVFYPRLTKDFVGNTMTIAKQSRLQEIARGIATLAPDRANVFVLVNDCTGEPAPGVRVAIEPSAGSTPFYFAGPYPSLVPKETSAAGRFAVAGFANVQPGSVTIGATVVSNQLAFAPTQAFTRAGALSYVHIYAQGP
jgi:hypothetical protein